MLRLRALLLLSVVLLGVVCVSCTATNTNALRGVKRRDHARYSGSTFTCDSGKVTIPSSQLNDNYCDCADGSDEPGTSACSNGVFYCTNIKAKGKTIKSSRVNDGICDCCDGSDEASFHGPSIVSCPNTCAEYQQKAQEALFAEIQNTERGHAVRQQMIQEAAATAEERRQKMLRITAKLETRKALVEQARAAKEAAEKIENEERERRQKAAQEAAAAQQQAAPASSDAQQPPAASDATPAQPAQAESSPPGVPPTDNAAGSGAGSPAADKPAENFPYPAEYAYNANAAEKKEEAQQNFPYPQEYAYNAENAAKKEDDDYVDAQYHDEHEHDEDGGSGHDDDEDEDSEEEDHAGVVSDANADATEYKSPEAEAARAEYEKLKKKLDKIEGYHSDLKKLTSHDFGEDDVFLPLYKKCFQLPIKQYTYEMCPYDNAKQKEGHSSTSLGNWMGVDKDDKGLFFKFENGQTCWNGPARSLKVRLQCGADNALLAVDEPSKCVYEMKMTTPAVCDINHAHALKMNLEATLSGDIEIDEEE